MTLRTALVIDGDASGATQAAAQTDAALGKVETAAASAAREADRAARLAEQQVVRVARQAAMMRQNLIFQLNDIGVSLASGMNPLMVAMQQGSQLATGPGGLGAALKETGNLAVGLATKFWPIGVAVAAVGAGIAGLQHEINRTGEGIDVSFGDTALAVLQTFGDYIWDVIEPAVTAIGTWWQGAWKVITDTTADVVNLVVREIIGGTDIIITTLASIPDAFVVVIEAALQAVSDGITWTIREMIAGVNGMIAGVNGIAEKAGLGRPLSDLGSPNDRAPYAKVDIGGSAAADALSKRWAGLGQRQDALANTDFAGQFFGDVAAHARQNALNRQDDDEKKAKGLERVTRAVREQRTAWDELADVGANAFDKLTDTILSGGKDIVSTLQSIAGDFAKVAFEMAITNPLKNSLFGGNAATFGGGSIGAGGLFGSLFGLGGLGGLKTSAGLGGLTGTVRSYAGGGFTGRGPRSGGIDGLGGSLAIVHPDETVVDHTAGGRGGMQPVFNFFNAPNQPETRPNASGGFDFIFAEVDRRLSNGTMGKGYAARHGLRPTTRRT